MEEEKRRIKEMRSGEMVKCKIEDRRQEKRRGKEGGKEQ